MAAEDDLLMEIQTLLGEIPEVPLPAQFDLDLKRRLDQEVKRRRTLRIKKWTAAAAMLTICLISGLMMKDGLNVLPRDLNVKGVEKSAEASDAAGDFDSEVSPEAQVIPEAAVTDGTAAGDAFVGYAQGETDVIIDGGGGTSPVVQRTDDKLKSKAPLKSYSAVPPVQAAAPSADSVMGNEVQTETAGENASQNENAVKNPTRSFTYIQEASEFEHACQVQLEAYIAAIEVGDTEALIASTNLVSAQLISEENAACAIRLYGDLFRQKPLTYEKNKEKSVSGVRTVYTISGSEKSLPLVILNTKDGLKLSEVVLNHGLWLDEKLSETEYVLENVCLKKDGSVEFTVFISVDATGQAVNETRSIVWEKAKSL